MNTATMILAIVPVVILMAFILLIVKEKVIDHSESSLDLKGVVGVLAVVLIAVVLMGSMIGDTIEYYDYDEQKGELTITYAVAERSSYPWDSYASDVRSLVIEDGVESIAAGAFSSLTGLEYMSISEGVESISPAAFGVSVEDYMGQPLASVASGEYAGIGDGAVYLCDPSIYTYNSQGMITGLETAASGATHLVFPREHNGTTIPAIANNSFKDNTAIVIAVSVPNSSVTIVGNAVFSGCTSLAHIAIPASTVTIGSDTFRSCEALTSVELPEGLESIGSTSFGFCAALESITVPSTLTSIGNYAFNGCSSLKGFTIPSGVATIGVSQFNNCSSLESITIPSTVTSIGNDAFSGCTGITSVSFGSGFSATLGTNCFKAWTFYESDGTTVIDKTVASNLAGKTFLGTAAALVEVAPGQLALTPQQFQQVQLHTQELQQQELDIQPLPFQPTVQTQDQEPVAA